MLKLLHDNYHLVRQVLPHPVWFSELTGIHPRVAGNVWSGTRKVSMRHILSITHAFGLAEHLLQQPIQGHFDVDSRGNLARQAWLRMRIRQQGHCRGACHQFPGLGLRTMHDLLQPGALVSPVTCELVSRHTGWAIHGSLLDDDPCLAALPSDHAMQLLRHLRLANHRPVAQDLLPKRTTIRMVAVSPQLRFSGKDFATIADWLMSGRLNPAVKGQFDWLVATIRDQVHAGIMTADEATQLRRLASRRRWLPVWSSQAAA